MSPKGARRGTAAAKQWEEVYAGGPSRIARFFHQLFRHDKKKDDEEEAKSQEEGSGS